MTRRLVAGFVVALGSSWVPCAYAQVAPDWKLGGAHVVVAAERAASVLYWREQDLDIPAARGRSHGIDASALSAGLGKSSSSMPRFAGDYVFPFGLSLGGNFGWGYSKDGHPSKVTDLPHHSAWVFGARAGYWRPLSSRIGVWPRLGVTAASHSTAEAGDFNAKIVTTLTVWDLTFDPQLTFVIAPRIVFTTGVVVDIGIAGKLSWDDDSGSSSRRYRSSAYGASAGLAVVF